MQELFNFPKNEVTKTNDKLSFKASRKEELKNIRFSTRDENFKSLIEKCGGLPFKNEILAIKTNGTSDCGSIFSYILNIGDIDEMYLATWTISKQNINRLKESLESGKLKKLVMVFSSTLKPANPSLYASLMSALKPMQNVELKEINSHAKTFSVKQGENYYTVSGSANWSENPRIENFLLLNNIEIYKHHQDWMSELTQLK